MASACIHEQDLGKVSKYLHSNIFSNIKSYKHGSYYLFLAYHCYRNKNGAKKRYSITWENSALILLILFVGEQ